MDEAIKCKRNSDNRHSTEASVRLKEMAIAMSKSHQDIEKYLMGKELLLLYINRCGCLIGTIGSSLECRLFSYRESNQGKYL